MFCSQPAPAGRDLFGSVHKIDGPADSFLGRQGENHLGPTLLLQTSMSIGIEWIGDRHHQVVADEPNRHGGQCSGVGSIESRDGVGVEQFVVHLDIVHADSLCHGTQQVLFAHVALVDEQLGERDPGFVLSREEELEIVA